MFGTSSGSGEATGVVLVSERIAGTSSALCEKPSEILSRTYDYHSMKIMSRNNNPCCRSTSDAVRDPSRGTSCKGSGCYTGYSLGCGAGRIQRGVPDADVRPGGPVSSARWSARRARSRRVIASLELRKSVLDRLVRIEVDDLRDV